MYLKKAAAKIYIILNLQIFFTKIIYESQMFSRGNLYSFKIILYHTNPAG